MLFKAEFTQTNELSHEKLLTSEPFLDTSAEATSTVVASANCGNIMETLKLVTKRAMNYFDHQCRAVIADTTQLK